MVIHKTQRRVMLKFLKQHKSRWSEPSKYSYCDLCYVRDSKARREPITLASYISKGGTTDPGPYSHGPPILCRAHAQELGLVW